MCPSLSDIDRTLLLNAWQSNVFSYPGRFFYRLFLRNSFVFVFSFTLRYVTFVAILLPHFFEFEQLVEILF